MTLPILYSLRNCPFAMRARLAIFKSGVTVELRDVNLKNKPAEMLQASSKGTVPTLVLPLSLEENETDIDIDIEGAGTATKVIDESFDVMLWALNESDPEQLLRSDTQVQANMLALIKRFDDEFKSRLENYKCAKRYHETNVEQCRQACEEYIQILELCLSKHTYIIDDNESLADIALLPFIRQFARVERPWYIQSPYPNVKRWLNSYLQSSLFNKVMAQFPVWATGKNISLFGSKVK